MTFPDYTTQEYFDRKGENLFGDAHAHIATRCITYLSFTAFANANIWEPFNDRFKLAQEFRRQPLPHLILTNDHFRLHEEFRCHPLTRYASAAWPHHAGNTKDVSTMDNLLSFLNQRDKFCIAFLLAAEPGWYSHNSFGLAFDMTSC